MLGINFIKFDSMDYVIHYQNGKLKKEGRGLSFFYFQPSASIVSIPLGSSDLPFIFRESTKDFQELTLQGQLSYKIEQPRQLAEVLDFTVDSNKNLLTNGLEKLEQRLVNEAQTATASLVRGLRLKEALSSSEAIEKAINFGLAESPVIKMLGVTLIGVNILAVKANPEMARALEAQTREALQQEADQAIYERRNFSVEQERRIKESELNTEIAIEEKQRQIAEKQIETEQVKLENDRKLREMKMQTSINVEDQRGKLVDMQSENARKEADAKAYTVKVTLEPYKEMDWRILTSLSGANLDAGSQIALAFRELAENAGKIGTLNISPDLLEQLVGKKGKNESK